MCLLITKCKFHNVNQVRGTLVVPNIYSNPFQPICSQCNLAVENFGSIQGMMLQCNKCQAQTTFSYQHRLKCAIVNKDIGKVPCTLRDNALKKLLPDLTFLSYEDYLKDKSAIIYMLRDFTVHGNFILNHDDIILDVDNCITK